MHQSQAWWKQRRWYLAAYTLALLLSHLVIARQHTKTEGTGAEILLPMYDGQGQAVSGKQSLVHWHEAGSGPTIVLLHGSPGEAADFKRLMPLLVTAGYEVLAIDLPGFGASEPYPQNFSNIAHAHTVLALLDALAIERAHVVGFSMSGGVALHLSQLAPARMRSITLLAAIGSQLGEGTGDYYAEHIKYALAYAATVIIPELVPHFGLMGPRQIRHSFARNFWDSDQRPYEQFLRELAAPLHIIHGRNDFLVPMWAAHRHHELAPRSQLTVFDNPSLLTSLLPMKRCGRNKHKRSCA